jgi:hypothetical protein
MKLFPLLIIYGRSTLVNYFDFAGDGLIEAQHVVCFDEVNLSPT